jgi:Ran GTPase-activating protein (RanGAP) involved in mRNA processing and transport
MDKSTFDGRIRSAMPRLETTSDSYVDSSSLPIPDQKTLDNYFSDNAQLHFNKKYRKLLHQAELLTGGKTELLSIVRRDGDPSKALKRAKEKLVRFGVMTPGEGHSGTNTPNPLNRLGPLSQLTRPKTANAAVISKPNLMKRPKTAIAGNSSAASFMAKKLERLSREEASQGPMLPRMGTPKVPKSVPPSPTLVRPPLLPNFPVNNAISAVTPFDGNNIEEKGDGIFVDEQSLDDSDYDSDNNHPSYSAATSNGSLASPRSIFLAGCVRYGLPPRSIAMLRKRISPVMNLAHMSIGNPTAILLAEALDRMPYLQTLNLADNNLSDDGLTAIIRCVAKHSTLEVLDISQNTISWGAAKAVGDYVGSSRCFLKSLRMSSAGIDDKECAAFVKVLMNNRMLKELDLSKNMLGKDENLNVVMPDFLTGGESLANLLRYSSCPLETLNLHWNMIRLEGAEILCDSIRNNSYLTDLNLSYNSLGSRAVCLLGMALIDNNRLRRLNLANNGIDSQGAITLSVGMRENQSLQQVILSGNPLGDQGARALMKVMVQEGHRLTVETEDCDITTRQNALALHINNPLGDYLLDMSQPHERAFAYELFDIIARDSNIDVSIFDLFLSSSSGEKVARNVAPDANSRPKSPSKDRNPSSGSGINANGEDGNVDPLAATIRQLGALTASYTIARFDEPKQRYVLSEHEKEEESFFSSLSPLHDVSPVTLLKTVRHYMIVNSDSFSVNNLPSIFDDLLHRRRRYANSVASKTNPDAHEGMKSGILSTDSFDETFILSGNSSGKGLSLEIPSSGNVSRTDSRYEGEGAFLTGITPTSAQSKGKERKEVEAFALGGNDSVFSADESKYDDAYQMPTEEVVRKIAAETRRLLDPRNSGVIDNDVFIEYITEVSFEFVFSFLFEEFS